MILQSENITKQYKGETKLIFPDIRIKQNEHLLLLGDSGSGKTTLLQILSGLLNPTSGTVTLKHSSLYELSESKRDQLRGKHIGLVYQNPLLIKSLTVKENIKAACRLSQSSFDPDYFTKLTKKLGIESILSKFPHQISQGQAQRTAVARGMITKPKLLLADEPTSSLDDSNAEQVVKLFLALTQEFGTTLIISTHDKRITDFFENKIVLKA